MTDIVERLRLAEAWFDVDSEPTVPVNTVYGKQLFGEAADEIELRRNEIGTYVLECANLKAEIERLRDALEAVHEYIYHATGALPIIERCLRLSRDA